MLGREGEWEEGGGRQQEQGPFHWESRAVVEAGFCLIRWSSLAPILCFFQFHGFCSLPGRA